MFLSTLIALSRLLSRPLWHVVDHSGDRRPVDPLELVRAAYRREQALLRRLGL